MERLSMTELNTGLKNIKEIPFTPNQITAILLGVFMLAGFACMLGGIIIGMQVQNAIMYDSFNNELRWHYLPVCQPNSDAPCKYNVSTTNLGAFVINYQFNPMTDMMTLVNMSKLEGGSMLSNKTQTLSVKDESKTGEDVTPRE